MQRRVPSRWTLPLVSVLLAGVAEAQTATTAAGTKPPRTFLPATAWVLDAAGGAGAHFTSGQAAIDAAAEGDVILVRSGDYSNVTLDGKGLQFIALQGADVSVFRFHVRNLGARQSVVLRGLEGFEFKVENCQGSVRLLDLSVTTAGEGVEVVDSTQVSLTRFTTSLAGGGGSGAILVQRSQAFVYDCDARGGFGSASTPDGSAGLLAYDSQVFVSGSRLRGGDPWGSSGEGDGGAGIRLVASTAHLLDNELLPGAPGCFLTCPWTPPLVLESGSSVVNLPGKAHRVTAIGPVPADGVAKLIFEGENQAMVFLTLGLEPAPTYVSTLHGVVHLSGQRHTRTIGPLPRSGVLEHFLSMKLPPFLEVRSVFYQALFWNPSGQGPDYAGAPDELVVADRHHFPTGPDCNGNLVPDAVDLVTGFSRDANANTLPDECLAEGDCNGNLVGDVEDINAFASTDFNANWIPDECPEDGDCNFNGIGDIVELLAGTSLDENRNLIPDECESFAIVHVDDDASGDPGPHDPFISNPAENGSSQAPFDTIQEGLDVAQTGDVVLVEDGVYPGDLRQGLGLRYGGRGIVLRSRSGAASCIIDVQGDPHAIRLNQGEPEGTRVIGFTITGATQGAVFLHNGSSLTVSACVLTGNRNDGTLGTLNNGYGGALRLGKSVPAGPCTIEDSLIVDNEADAGGGIAVSRSDLLIRNCTIAGNAKLGPSSAPGGSGLNVSEGTTLVEGSIIALNTGSTYQLYTGSSSTLVVTYSNVEDSAMGTLGGSYVFGEGSIEAPPRFVDPSAGDYRLLPDSPCVDTGTFGYAAPPNTRDVAAEPRVVGGEVDMGAHEL